MPRKVKVPEKKLWDDLPLNVKYPGQYTRIKFVKFKWTKEDKDLLAALHPSPCHYLHYSEETCPTTGNPHLDGYLEVREKQRISFFRKILPYGTNIRPANGTAEENYNYSAKESRPSVFGVPTAVAKKEKNRKNGQNEAAKWADIRRLLKEGNREELEANYFNYVVRYNLKRYLEYPCPETVEGPNYWLYGEAGTGKSEFPTKLAKSYGYRLYKKLPHKWFGEYKGEEVVFVDDIDRDKVCPLVMLKALGEHRAFICETKGGEMKIRPQHVVITSNQHPFEVFSDLSVQDQNALKRRYIFLHFKNVVHSVDVRKRELSAELLDYVERAVGEEVKELHTIIEKNRVLPPIGALDGATASEGGLPPAGKRRKEEVQKVEENESSEVDDEEHADGKEEKDEMSEDEK